jgi:ribonuclease Z
MTYQIWNHEFKIPHTNFSLKGHSRAAEKTAFYIPQLNIFLDAGVQSPFNPEFIFITHTHSDHCFALPMILTNITTHPTIFVVNEMKNLIDNFIMSTYKLTAGTEDENLVKRNYLIHPIINAEKFSINTKGNQIIHVEVFKLDHTVPTCGYGFSSQKSKIKSEYRGKSSKEIIELKRNKVDITDTIIDPFLCYILDTSIEALNNESIFKYPTIIIECTFIKEEHQKQADETKHINWIQLFPYIKKYPEITFILCHFSLRYQNIDIENFFKEETQLHQIDNIVVWLN